MKNIATKTTLTALGLAAGLTLAAQADENLWLYTTGTDTRPKGSFELKLSSNSHIGKGEGDYNFTDFRPELEYGITDKLTVFGELMIFDHRYSGFDSENADGDSAHDPIAGSKSVTQYGGFELGFKYNVLSAYKDPIGLSFGLAFEHRDIYRLDGADIDQDSLVPSIFLQKNWLDNQLTWAFTGKMELERRKSPSDNSVSGVLEEEIAFDLSTGLAYRFAPNWTVGVEARYQTDHVDPVEDGISGSEAGDFSSLGDLTLGGQFQYGLYVGPSIHYSQEGWWATASILFLVDGGGDESRNISLQEYGKPYDEHEKIHLGLTVGFEF